MWMTDRPVLVLIVLLNITVLTRLSLRPETVIGALNGSLAAAMLTLSVRSPECYARHRLVLVILLRLLVCALPLMSDTISPFDHGLDSRAETLPPLLRRLGRALFMLLVSVSWAVGLFLASFLQLLPVQHLVVQAAALIPLLLHNRSACQHFLAQHPSNAAAIDTLEACLHTLAVSVAPVGHGKLGAARPRVSRTASCQAGATALQVSLGLVLPTLLAWQLQSSTSAGGSMAVEQANPPGGVGAAVQQRRRRGARLAAAVARNTQGWAAKLLFTGSSMLLTFSLCIEVLDRG